MDTEISSRVRPVNAPSWAGFLTVVLGFYACMLFLAEPNARTETYSAVVPDIKLNLPHRFMEEPQEAVPVFSTNPRPVLHRVKTGKYTAIINKAAQKHEVDPALIKAVIMAESSYNPRAVSKRGARGLMQLMPRTAKSLGVKDCFDPENNINGGTKYLKYLLDRFDGDIELALAAYNAGRRNVLKYGGVPPYKATRYYIRKVNAYYRTYKALGSEKMNQA